MKKLLLTFLLLWFPLSANAALTFNASSNTNVIDIASPIGTNTMPTLTLMAWVYPTSLVNNSDIIRKNNLAAVGWDLRLTGTAGNVTAQVDRTVNSTCTTTDTPLATLNKWYFVVFTFDINATPVCRIYIGDLTTAAIDKGITPTAGSGTQGDDTGTAIAVGNIPGGGRPWQGRMSNVAVVNRALTIGEARSWQFHPRVITGTKLFYILGYSGLTTQTDWSGTGNAGSISGALFATSTNSHIPLRSPFGF